MSITVHTDSPPPPTTTHTHTYTLQQIRGMRYVADADGKVQRGQGRQACMDAELTNNPFPFWTESAAPGLSLVHLASPTRPLLAS
jgi:hypothetical protein